MNFDVVTIYKHGEKEFLDSETILTAHIYAASNSPSALSAQSLQARVLRARAGLEIIVA